MEQATETVKPETQAPPTQYMLPNPLPEIFEIPEDANVNEDIKKQLDDAKYVILHNVDLNRKRHYYAIKGKEHAACNGRGKVMLAGADANAGKYRVCPCAEKALAAYLTTTRVETSPAETVRKPTVDEKETARIQRVVDKLQTEIAEILAKKGNALGAHLENKFKAEETVANAGERHAMLNVRVKTLETVIADAKENIVKLQAQIKNQHTLIDTTTKSLDKVNTEDRPGIEHDVKKAQAALVFVAGAVEKISKKYDETLAPLLARLTRLSRKLPKE